MLTPALRFLSNQVWAIHPPIFESLSALLEARANGSPAAYDDGSKAPKQAGEPGPRIVGNTAVVPVRGVLARYADQINGACQDTGRSAESLQRDLMTLAADPRVAQIVLHLDSPGGTVAGTAETADVIRSISDSGKPVVAFVDGMAASAAYWLASQCDKIVMAGPTSEVGSIGVITAHVDQTKAQEKQGYKVQVFRTSALKAPGAMGEALGREQVAAIEKDLADFHAVFAQAVQQGRGMSDEQIAAATSGEMWRPEQAISMGLADAVGSLDALCGCAPTPQKPHKNDAAAKTATSKKADAMTDSLLDLIEAAPAHAGVIAKLGKEGKQAAEIKAHLADLDRAAALADMSAKVEAADKAKADALAKLEAAEKAHAEAIKAKDAELADLKAKHDQLKSLAGAPKVKPEPKGGEEAKKISRAEFDAMTGKQRSAFMASGGIVA